MVAQDRSEYVNWEFPSQPQSGQGQSVGRATATDPSDDTFGTGFVQLDISTVNATILNNTLTLSVEFFGSISPGGSGHSDEVVGFIDIDADQNEATGIQPFSNIFCAPTGMGADYFLHVRDVDVDGMLLLDSTFTPVGRAPVTYLNNSFSLEIPLAMLGDDDGYVDISTVLGTPSEATDCAPDGSFLTSDRVATGDPVPTLKTWGLFAFLTLLMGCAIVIMRRSRTA